MSHIKRWQTPAEIKAHRKAQAKYESSPKEIKKRENRNAARAYMEHLGKARKGDGKDIGHSNGNALDNSPSNFMVQSRHSNRSYKRDKKAHKADPTS